MTDSKKRVTLPALHRAMRNNLTILKQDNGPAAVTLARLHRTMSVGETDEGDVQGWDFEAEDAPVIEGRLVTNMTAKKLAQIESADFRVIRDGEFVHAEVFKDGSWCRLEERWRLRPANDNAPKKPIEPKIVTSRRAFASLDVADRDLFEELVPEDALADMELISAGATMTEIGEAAGFTGKQAEAVGLDRTRRAVAVAQRAFGTVGRANASTDWWRGLR
jgi:hypothetical protein